MRYFLPILFLLSSWNIQAATPLPWQGKIETTKGSLVKSIYLICLGDRDHCTSYQFVEETKTQGQDYGQLRTLGPKFSNAEKRVLSKNSDAWVDVILHNIYYELGQSLPSKTLQIIKNKLFRKRKLTKATDALVSNLNTVSMGGFLYSKVALFLRYSNFDKASPWTRIFHDHYRTKLISASNSGNFIKARSAFKQYKKFQPSLREVKEMVRIAQSKKHNMVAQYLGEQSFRSFD